MAVVDTPCPNEIVCRPGPSHADGGGTMPADSPGPPRELAPPGRADPEGGNKREDPPFPPPGPPSPRAGVARFLDVFPPPPPPGPPPAGIAGDDPPRCQQRPAAEEALSRRHD